MLLLILFLILAFIFTVCKVFIESWKPFWETSLAVLTVIVGGYGLYTQDQATKVAQRKNFDDSVRHNREMIDLRHQNDILNTGIQDVTGISSNLKQTVDKFDSLYKRNALAQDTINEAITGGDNFPIVEVSIGNFNTVDSVLFVHLQNNGKSNLRLIHFELNNSFNNASESNDYILMVRGSGSPQWSYKIPKNTSKFSIDGTVRWDGINFRAYIYWLEFKKNNDGIFGKPIEHFRYLGQNNGKEFDPKVLLKEYFKKSKRHLNNK